jgi:hypothetical protein
VQFLVEFGAFVGRNAHFVAEADQHYTNEFVVLVGKTGKGRKGSSRGHVGARFREIDSTWASDHVVSGLSTGEGLIWHVRDLEDDGDLDELATDSGDSGVSDKRLLAVEPEFALVLRKFQREGNSLSATLRGAWDSGNMRTLTKNSPTTATDAHISIIGHITLEELNRYLDSTEMFNGFGNRFLWVCVDRSKQLPEGGRLDGTDWSDFQNRLKEAVEAAEGIAEVGRDFFNDTATTEIYTELSEGRPGLFGAAIGRAEAHTMRLAMLYALLDSSSVIRRIHLEAALEVWRYCEDSAKHIFGKSLGDSTADRILEALRSRSQGMTRDAIRNLFQRHKDASNIARALDLLSALGLAHMKKMETGGRPAERWFATEVGCAESAESAESPVAKGETN